MRNVLEKCGFPVVPSSNFLIGNLDVMKDERTPFRFEELRQKYGKTYAIMQGAFPTIVTSDVDLIQEICLKKFRYFHSRMTDPTSGDPDKSRGVHVFAARGERWKRIRTVTSPALSTQNLRNISKLSTYYATFQLFTTIRDSVDRFIDGLLEDNNNSAPIELHRLLLDFSIFIGYREEDFDFLQFLKNVEDNEWNGWRTSNDVRTDISTIKIDRKMTAEEIVEQMRFLSTAGFDTTANTLTYLTYLLAIHADKQQKLRDEIDECDELCFDVINQLNYLQWCIAETLRLFPHASLLQSRRCVEDCEASSFKFKRGINIAFDTWSLHHDREVWGEDAGEFRPERFADRNSEQLKSWTPFGVGPRMCIGMRFALLEIKTAMFQIMKNFRILKATPSDQVSIIVIA
ncbi:unnamed protein product [Anisakis simplex]|uniref:Cytochrome P450 n=1 Tax=Anisakis simplex TaxID=6269 RepID=A0A158PN73_ANISI|nr:unnamed protein product [Anisakis simplex]